VEGERKNVKRKKSGKRIKVGTGWRKNGRTKKAN